MINKFQWPIIWGNFISSSFNFTLFLLASLLLQKKTTGSISVPLILGCANLVAAILQPFIGRISDNGRLNFITFIAFILNAIGIFTLHSSNFFVLIMSSSMLLMSSAIIQTSSSRLLEGLAPTAFRSKVASFNYMLCNLGYAISACLAFFFLKDYRSYLLILDLLTTGLSCYFIAKFGSVQSINSNTKIIVKNDEKQLCKYQFVKKGSLNIILKEKNILLAILFTLPLFMNLVSSFSIIQFIFSERNLDYSRFSSLLICVSSLAVTMGYFFFNICKLNDLIKIIIGGFALCMGIILISYTRHLSDCILSSIVWSVGEILIIGECSAIFYQLIPADYPGLAAGIKVGTIKLACVICPLLVTIMGELEPLKITYSFGIPSVIAAILLYGLKYNVINVRKVPRRVYGRN